MAAMTKSQESGENEITRKAKRIAFRTNKHVCEILASMLAEAKAADETELIQKIKQAQKYMGCRNIRKRKGQK
jgi:hypothetical protein